MKKSLRLLVAVGASSVVISALASAPVVARESAGEGPGDSAAKGAPLTNSGVARAAKQVPLLAGPSNGAPSYVGPARGGTHRLAKKPAKQTATFRVTYHGFTPAARTAFQSAVNVWKTRVTSSVPITVDATFEPLGAGILGQAGPNFFWRDFGGRPLADTWYADAIANKRHGSQLNSAPDIVASFSSSFPNWFFGTGGATPAGKYDFKTVVLHELGHGLGFVGFGRVSGSQGAIRASDGIENRPAAYDRFTENLGGTKLLAFADPSVALGNQLKSNNVYFDSALVRNANAGRRARLYAPNPFQGGSSYSHLNEATFPAGNPHSLMTPQLSTAEAIHVPGGITLGLFKSIGW